MATWNVKANCRSTTIEISDSSTPSQVADLLAGHGLVNKAEMFGQIYLTPEKDGSLTLVDDSGFPYAELRRAQQQTLGDIAATASQPVSNLPKCPVCGSTRLTKISAVGRLATGFVYGGLSPEGRAQYVCQSCDYKF